MSYPEFVWRIYFYWEIVFASSSNLFPVNNISPEFPPTRLGSYLFLTFTSSWWKVFKTIWCSGCQHYQYNIYVPKDKLARGRPQKSRAHQQLHLANSSSPTQVKLHPVFTSERRQGNDTYKYADDLSYAHMAQVDICTPTGSQIRWKVKLHQNGHKLHAIHSNRYWKHGGFSIESHFKNIICSPQVAHIYSQNILWLK